MGLLHRLKVGLSPAKDKVSRLAQQHGSTIAHGLDKAAEAVDERTKGRYSDRIRTSTGKAKDAVDRLARQGEAGAGGGTTPPESPTEPHS